MEILPENEMTLDRANKKTTMSSISLFLSHTQTEIQRPQAILKKESESKKENPISFKALPNLPNLYRKK